jgi:hypothetical protein
MTFSVTYSNWLFSSGQAPCLPQSTKEFFYFVSQRRADGIFQHRKVWRFHAASFCSGDTPEVFARDGGEIGAENASLVGVK